MATSCGSPCYAAPELVLQDGQYVGSAVDVWSCGVILYAMLSGYLPYDDDPANPDGDNINLLYRYITTTRLSFPEWISPEPRELLLMMLVADPDKRCRLQDVRYSSFFQNTVPDLEMQAEAQYEEKRILLARQQEHYFRSTGQALPPHLQRSQSSMAGFEGQQPILGQNSSSNTTAQQRHRSAMVHSVTTQSMIPEFSAVHSQQQQFQQPRPSLPTHLLPHAATSGLISPPLSPPSTSMGLGESTNRQSSPFTLQPPASAYPHIQFSDPFAASSNGVTGNAPSSPLRQQQQQQLQQSDIYASSSAMQPSLSAPGDVETISDSLTSEGEMRGEPRSRRTDDDDASTTSSSNRGTRSSAAAAGRGGSTSSGTTAAPMSPGGGGAANTTESKKRKGEEKRHTISAAGTMEYPASPPAESTRSKTKARESLTLSSPTTTAHATSPSLPANIAAYLGTVGEAPRDPRLPILEAAAAAESMDVHMQSPNHSPARSTDEQHHQQQVNNDQPRLPTVRTAPSAGDRSASSRGAAPTISPVDERAEAGMRPIEQQQQQQERPLQPKMTAPQPFAAAGPGNVTPPSSPLRETVSPSRTPKRSNGAASAAAAREALEASQRTPRASQQQQQQAGNTATNEQPRSSAVPFPSPKQEKRPSTATATHFDLSKEVRPSSGTAGSGKSAFNGAGQRHKKGLSLSRLLGSSTTSVDRTDAAGEPSRSRKDSFQESLSRPASSTGQQGTLSSIDEDHLDKSRNRRRKALSLVVDPFGRSSSSAAVNAQAKNRRSARIQPTTPLDASGRARSGTAATAAAAASSSRPSGLPTSSSTAQFPVSPSLTSITATPGQSRQSLLPASSQVSQLPSPIYQQQQQQVEQKQTKRGSGWFGKWSKSSRDSGSGVPHSSSLASGMSQIPQPSVPSSSYTKRNSISSRPASMAVNPTSSTAPITRSRQSTATQQQPTVVVTSANNPGSPTTPTENATQSQQQQQQRQAQAPQVERVVATPAEARTFASTHRSGLTAQRSLRNKVVGASEASSDGAFDDSKLKVHSGGMSF